MKQSWHSLLQQIRQSELAKNAIWLTGGTAMAQVIPVVFMLVFARYFSNASIGIYNLFFQGAIILGSVANGRLEQPVLAVQEDERAKHLFELATKYNLGFSLLCLLLCVFLLVVFPGNNIVAGLGMWMIVLPVSIFFNGFGLLQSYSLNRYKQYKAIAAGKILQVIVANLTSFMLVLLFPERASYLIIGFLCGQTVLMFYYYSRNQLRIIHSSSSGIKPPSLSLLKAYKEFPLYNKPALLVDQLAASIPLFFVSVMYGNSEAGDYGLAMRILSVPTVFIAASVSQLFYKHAVDTSHAGGSIQQLVKKTFRNMFFIGLLPFGVILIFGPALVSFFFGAKWEAAGVICSYLALASLSKFPVSVMGNVFVVVGRIRLQASWQVTSLLIALILAVTAYWASWPLTTYLIWVVVTDIALYVMYYLMMLSASRNFDHPIG